MRKHKESYFEHFEEELREFSERINIPFEVVKKFMINSDIPHTVLRTILKGLFPQKDINYRNT